MPHIMYEQEAFKLGVKASELQEVSEHQVLSILLHLSSHMHSWDPTAPAHPASVPP
jgi:hypothetical protein